MEDILSKIEGITPIQTELIVIPKEETDAFFQPYIHELCRMIFDPTDEERMRLKEYVKNMDMSFEWRVIIDHTELFK